VRLTTDTVLPLRSDELVMLSTSTPTAVDRLLRSLVAYRRPVYLGGMIAISLPLLLATGLGIELSRVPRILIVGVSLGVMSLTYVGERRVDHDGTPIENADEGYPLKQRVAIGVAAVGAVLGAYVTLEMDPRVGPLYFIGAYLFGYRVYRKAARGKDS
jgi:hypothetical protein